MLVAIALGEPALARGLPLLAVDDERRVRKLRRAAGVVVVQVRHDDDGDLVRLDAAGAQLLGSRLAARLPRRQDPCPAPAEARARIVLHGPVKAGVDQQAARRRMLDEEHRHGDRRPARASSREADAQLHRGPGRRVERARGDQDLAAAHRVHAHRRAGAAARQRQRRGVSVARRPPRRPAYPALARLPARRGLRESSPGAVRIRGGDTSLRAVPPTSSPAGVRGPLRLAAAVLLAGVLAVWLVKPIGNPCPDLARLPQGATAKSAPSFSPPLTRTCTYTATAGVQVRSSYVPWLDWIVIVLLAAAVGGGARMLAPGARAPRPERAPRAERPPKPERARRAERPPKARAALRAERPPKAERVPRAERSAARRARCRRPGARPARARRTRAARRLSRPNVTLWRCSGAWNARSARSSAACARRCGDVTGPSRLARRRHG